MAGANSKSQNRSRGRNNVNFLKGMQMEMKKVVWPTRRELVMYTIVVIVSVAFVSALIAVVDGIFNHFFDWLMALVG